MHTHTESHTQSHVIMSFYAHTQACTWGPQLCMCSGVKGTCVCVILFPGRLLDPRGRGDAGGGTLQQWLHAPRSVSHTHTHAHARTLAHATPHARTHLHTYKLTSAHTPAHMKIRTWTLACKYTHTCTRTGTHTYMHFINIDTHAYE